MGNELDEALRAAAAAASSGGRTTTSPHANAKQSASCATVLSMSKRAMKNAAQRKRRRSRSDSMASEAPTDDAAQRIQAFKERMFEVGKDAASVTFSSAVKTGEDVVKMQWKGKKAVGGRQENGDEDAVPQLTRARVVSNRLKPEPQSPVKAAYKKKKNAQQVSQVFELRVPPSQPPVKSPATPKQVAAIPAAKSNGRIVPLAKSIATSKRKESDAERSNEDDMEDAGDSSADDTEDPPVPVSVSAANVPKAALSVPKAANANDAPAKLVGRENARATSASPIPAKKQALAKATASVDVKVQPVKKPIQSATLKKATVVPMVKPTPKAAAAAPKRTPTADDNEQDDMWDINTLVQSTVKKAAQRKHSVSDDDDGDDRGGDAAAAAVDDSQFDGKVFREHRMHLFSQLIDEAAREQWELVEVGRLVRIFAAQWSHKKKKTAKFLRRFCPELVSVDFLEGLDVSLTPKQLLKVFDRGSGSLVVFMNKVASAVENGNLSVRDEDFLAFAADKTAGMATNLEVLEFLMPLLESLSTVRDVGVLLNAICEHWHLDRTAALVQDILLTPVFDDLDGQQDEILEDLPALEGRLDFPSRMDAEDADENGNLKGLIAGEESDLGESDAHSEDEAEEKLGEIDSDEAEGEDSHAEDEVYDGETDSEEERMMHERLNPTKRRKSRFVLEEADEDDEPEEDGSGGEEDDFIADDDDSEGSSDDSSSSDEEGAPPKPQRKRLRRG